MDDPVEAEALLIRDGTVAAVGTRCSTTGEASLDDQVHQTAIFESSPFIRQP